MPNDLELEVFKTGDYGPKGTWGAADLDGIAADYDPALHEAPVTIDHAQSGPALGWVAGLKRVGDRLVARLRGLNDRLLELIRAGAFKKRSVEIYPALKESGRPYLRAVSFLGAAAPEVKGLADPIIMAESPLFDDGTAGHLQFEMDEESNAVARPSGRDETIEMQENEKEKEKEKEKESNKEETMAAFTELRHRLQSEGRWQPAWGDRGIAEFFQALAAIDELRVSEHETINAGEWFARFLEELPPIVAMGEAAPASAGNCGGFNPMTIPSGPNVDPDSIALHRRVVAFMEDKPGTHYAEALRVCAK